MSIILKNATYINWETLEFSETHIKVHEGIDGKIEFFENLDKTPIDEKDTIIDCEGKYVTKSFAVGHHHAYSALAKGMPAPKKSPEDFSEILKYIWWNLDKALDKETIEASALATAMAAAKAGSAFIIDHHASPNNIKGSLDVIAKAFDKVGMSHLLCYEISDRDGLEKAQEGLDETYSFLENNQGLVGLHASFTIGDNTLKKAVKLMEQTNSGIHIHVAEDQMDQAFTIEHYGKRVVERLHDFGALDSSKTILAHCLHVDEKERDILRKARSFVVQNAESNLNNNVGFFNSRGLGDNIMLGTDGMHSDMIRSAQSAFFAGKAIDKIDFDSTYERFQRVHHYLKSNNFKGDGENNLVVLDYDAPTEMNSRNFLGHFVFGWNTSQIEHVISNGELILKNRILQKVNEQEVLQYTKEQANRLWKKL